jgi:hypothetical protein
VACASGSRQGTPTGGPPGAATGGSGTPAAGAGGQSGAAPNTDDAAAGGAGGGGAPDASPAPTSPGTPGDAGIPSGRLDPVVVEPFKATHVYYVGGDNRRKVYAEVDFPAGQWKSVSLHLHLGCPPGRCDRWDRWGYIGIANGEGMAESITEIARFGTPFGGTADWTVDVSPLLPLLSGHKKVAVQIDTWVGPGNPEGDGWLVDASFTFAPGVSERVPVQVIPLWDVALSEVGDPAKPLSLPARMVQIPPDADAVELRSFITGHGQGNLQNCAEFCPKTHTYLIGETSVQRRLWREDCASFCTLTTDPGSGRQFCKESPTGAIGSVRASRANWCPGALVTPWSVDVTAAAKATGTSTTISYAPEAYENSCRPGVQTCQGCAFNTGCDYNNSSHTAPKYLQSALLIIYKRAAP